MAGKFSEEDLVIIKQGPPKHHYAYGLKALHIGKIGKIVFWDSRQAARGSSEPAYHIELEEGLFWAWEDQLELVFSI